MGYLWRRLSSKCANAFAVNKVVSYLSPRQVGVGVRGGCEAAIHATRRFVSTMPQEHVCVKLDFSNAFNSIYRDCLLSCLDELIPEISPFCHLAYAGTSTLQFGEFQIFSQVGAQQGDPLGPLLFCLPLQKVLNNLSSPLVLSYLDDVTLAGPADFVSIDIRNLERECNSIGLRLNESKFELIADRPFDTTPLNQFILVNPNKATLLGAPLSNSDALHDCLDACCSNLSLAFERLGLIDRHDALILLRSSLGSPKMIYLLRSSPCHGHPLLFKYDSSLHLTPASIFFT